MIACGNLKKMRTRLDDKVQYELILSESIEMNELIGNEIILSWKGKINCQKCGKITKSSFGEGFCYSCFISAPEAGECILRPELCRAHLGEGRDPQWEQDHHNQPHVVYLAASSAVKVGITRLEQVPTRWIDQGASSALILAVVPNRYEAGRIEVALKDMYTDKTNWRKMLQNDIDESIDLSEEKWSLEESLPGDITDYFSDDDEALNIQYPVLKYPTKVSSVSFDKMAEIKGTLAGIKGQYLLFDDGRVLNIRKHTGYEIEIG
jgi:hypothetical protein